jgi:hypothetical protein
VTNVSSRNYLTKAAIKYKCQSQFFISWTRCITMRCVLRLGSDQEQILSPIPIANLTFKVGVVRAGIRLFFSQIIIAVLSGANPTKLDFSTPLDRFPPAKSTAGNPCAAFGPGFVKVQGTCAKVGGRVDVSGPAGSR